MSDSGNGNSEKHIQKAHRDWRDVAREAANETNPDRLSELVHELCQLLDQERCSHPRPKR